MSTIGKHYDLDTDVTLANNSDNTIASQKATKAYIDNNYIPASAMEEAATVAKTGDYNDLINKPTIPTVGNAEIEIQKNSVKVDSFTTNQSGNKKTINITVPTKTSDITNDSGFLTSHQSIKILKTDNTTTQTASSSEAIAGSGTINLHKVSKTGSYSDLLNKPTIPTVNDSTITIQKNSTTVDSFTTNAASNKNINITLSKGDVGLGNVDNTADLDKPISNATQTALNAKQNTVSDLGYIRNQVAKVDDKIGSQDITDSGDSLPSAANYSVNDTFLNKTDKKLYTVLTPAYQLNTNTTVEGNVTVDLTTGVASGFTSSSSPGDAGSGVTRSGAVSGWVGDVQYKIHFKLNSLPNSGTYYNLFSISGSSYKFDFMLTSIAFYVNYAYSYMGPTSYGDDVELFNYSNWEINKEYFLIINKSSDGSVITSLMETSYTGNILAQGTATYNYACTGTVLNYGRRNGYYGNGGSFTIGQIYLADSTGNFLVADGALTWDSGTTLIDNTQYNDTTNEKTLYYNNNILYETVDNTSVQGRVLGQIIHSLIPLNDAGLHLADGSLIDGNGVYKDFYDYMENLYNNTATISSELYRLGTYSRINVTISDDFIASNFSDRQYLKVPNGRNNASEFVIKFKTSSDITTYQKIQHCEFFCCIELRSSVISTWDWQNSQNRTILSSVSANTDYWIKVIINGTTKTFYTSTDGINYTQSLSYSDTGMDYSSTYDFVLGVSSLDQLDPFLGTIDLKEFYTKNTATNRYIYKFVVSSKGDFINQDDYNYLYDRYGACGKFVIDTINKTIRLPYIDNIIQGTITASDIGTLQEEGLPNITATFSQLGSSITTSDGTIVSGALYETARHKYLPGGSADYVINGGFSARLSNDIYGNSNGKIQPQTVKAYIYIVIATLTKTNIEVNIDNIATDLNNKADKDLVNVSPSDVRNALDNANAIYITGTYRNGFSWHNIYSDGWVEQGGRFKTESGTGYKDINLLVEMADTNFDIYVTRGAESTTSNYNVWAQNPGYTGSTTMIRVYISNTAAYVYWRVAGQSKTS